MSLEEKRPRWGGRTSNPAGAVSRSLVGSTPTLFRHRLVKAARRTQTRTMSHDHDHDHDHGSELSEMQARVRALETILTEKGYVDPAALDPIVEAFETSIGPRNGARIVARAWTDAASSTGCWPTRPRPPIRSTSSVRRQPSDRGREHARAAQHGRVHAVLLLSVGGARPAAGLVQIGALSLRAVIEPRARARRFRRDVAGGDANPGLGFDRRDAVSGVADAARRHGRLDEDRLADLVTRDSMIGTGLPAPRPR